MEAAIAERVEQYLADVDASRDGDGEGRNSSLPFEEMKELILDGHPIRSISAEDAKTLLQFTSLAKLTINQTGLKTLKNMPFMKQLYALELTDNHISGELDIIVKSFPHLKKLHLGGNHIKTLEDIKPLAGLMELEQLGLDLNPVCSVSSYRESVLEILPSLSVLDYVDRNGRECDVVDSEDDDDGSFDEPDTTLKQFYEGDLPDDEEDNVDFAPENEEEDDEDISDEELEDEEDMLQDDFNKRKIEGDLGQNCAKNPRLN